jgi:hypothetical protein
MHPTLLRWIAASRPWIALRVGVFAFAALGHYAFLATLFWDQAAGDVLPLVLAAPNLIVVALALFGRTRLAWMSRGLTLPIASSALALTVVHFVEPGFGSFEGGSDGWTVFQLPIVGALCGFFGATVATPLARAIGRWRDDPSPRRALDVWATLACMAVVFAGLRPSAFEHLTWAINDFNHPSTPCHHLALARALRVVDLAMAVAGFIVAAAVMLLDARLRGLTARARAGALGGAPSAGPAATEGGGVTSFATMHDEPMVALVGARGEAGYRATAPEQVLALLPQAPRLSWRLVAMPLVMAAHALGLWSAWTP